MRERPILPSGSPLSPASPLADAPIVVEGLNHWFGTGEARKQVLFDVDLALERGRLTMLLGASGSGKTTLLTLMGCLRHVEAGRVRLLGEEINGAPEAVLVRCRRRLGFIFQAHNLHESPTTLQNVRMGLEVHGRAAMADATSRSCSSPTRASTSCSTARSPAASPRRKSSSKAGGATTPPSGRTHRWAANLRLRRL